MRAGFAIILLLMGLGGCAAISPDAVKNGYPAATLFPGALPQCRADEDVGPCTEDPRGQLASDEAFPDGGYRDVVRDKIRQKRENR